MAKTETSNAPPGRPRDKTLDETLIRTALDLLCQTGVESVTMARVGRLSGIPATSIYRRYPDARSLILAAIKDDLDRTQFDVEDQGSLPDDLMAFLRMVARALHPQRARMLAGLLLPIHTDAELAALFTEKLETLRREGWSSIIDRAVRRGTLKPQALGAQPLDDVAQTMIFYRIVVRQLPADDGFLNDLLDTVLMPALTSFLVESNGLDRATAVSARPVA